MSQQQPGPDGVWGAPSAFPQQPQQPQQPQPYGIPPQQQPYGYGAPPPPFGAAPQGYPPMWGAPVPPRRSRKPWIIGGSVALALVLGVGGVIAYLVYDRLSSLGTHRLVPPAEFQGMSRTGNEASERTLRSGMLKAWDKDSRTKGKLTPVAAVYGSRDSGRFVAWGGYGKIIDAGSEADQGLDGIAEGGAGTLGARKSYDPGPLGGTLSCAPLERGSQTVGVCAWADGSTVVLVMDGTGKAKADLDATAERVRAYRSATEVPE